MGRQELAAVYYYVGEVGLCSDLGGGVIGDVLAGKLP